MLRDGKRLERYKLCAHEQTKYSAGRIDLCNFRRLPRRTSPVRYNLQPPPNIVDHLTLTPPLAEEA
jgi:hypothetical protein